jgi:hypothetical protein
MGDGSRKTAHHAPPPPHSGIMVDDVKKWRWPQVHPMEMASWLREFAMASSIIRGTALLFPD